MPDMKEPDPFFISKLDPDQDVNNAIRIRVLTETNLWPGGRAGGGGYREPWLPRRRRRSGTECSSDPVFNTICLKSWEKAFSFGSAFNIFI